MGDTRNALGLSDAQLRHSNDIVATAKKMGMSLRDAQIAITVAITESGIRELANTNVPSSLNYPHEGVGSDHASLGEFQQQTPGWGTVSELMQPHVDAVKFLNALKLHTNRTTLLPWQAAQAVQRSAYSDGSNYQRNWSQGSHIASALWGAASSDSSPGGEAPFPANTLKAPLSSDQRRKMIAFMEARGVTASQIGKWLDPIAFGGAVDLNDYINHGNAAQDALLITAYAAVAAGGGIQASPKVDKEETGIIGALHDIAHAVSGVGAFFEKLGWIFNADHFMRFLLYVGGGGAVIAGLFMVAHSTKD